MPCTHKAFSKQRWALSQKAEIEELQRHKSADHVARLRARAAARYMPWITLRRQQLGAERQLKVLDVACGAMCLASELAHVDAYFVDPLLDVYRRELPGSLPDLPETHMIAGEAEQLRFADDSFDFILFLHGISHVYNPELVLHEVERVLRPEGLALISAIVWPVWTSRCYYRCSPWLPKAMFRNRLYCYSARGIRKTLARHFDILEEVALPRESWYGLARELLFVCKPLS